MINFLKNKWMAFKDLFKDKNDMNEKTVVGFMSFAIALFVVLMYMAYYYSTAGWVANVALVANIFFIVGALAAFPILSILVLLYQSSSTILHQSAVS